jgi:glycosyl-4,4'-diaponeurosporenoate acyltransferase
MQIIFLPTGWTLLLVFVLWPTMQVAAAVISRVLPDRLFRYSSGFYRCHTWEKDGNIYNRVFRIRQWKHLLPDGGSIVRGGYAKKHLTDFSQANLAHFLDESCRAEFSHWLAILPFWVFGLLADNWIILYMFLYAVVINMPCILAQRFNRPRIARRLACYRTQQT